MNYEKLNQAQQLDSQIQRISEGLNLVEELQSKFNGVTGWVDDTAILKVNGSGVGSDRDRRLFIPSMPDFLKWYTTTNKRKLKELEKKFIDL